jgi:hypothetical protein
MVVNDPDIIGCSVMPSKTDPPLLIDADAVLPPPIALQRFEPIAGRYAEIVQRSGLIQHTQLTQSSRLDLYGQSPTSKATPNARCLGIGKALDHGPMIASSRP